MSLRQKQWTSNGCKGKGYLYAGQCGRPVDVHNMDVPKLDIVLSNGCQCKGHCVHPKDVHILGYVQRMFIYWKQKIDLYCRTFNEINFI